MTHVTEETEAKAEELKGLIEESSTDIQSVIDDGTALAENSEWSGPDADTWRDNWVNEVSPALNTVKTQLAELTETTQSILDGIFRAAGRV